MLNSNTSYSIVCDHCMLIVQHYTNKLESNWAFCYSLKWWLNQCWLLVTNIWHLMAPCGLLLPVSFLCLCQLLMNTRTSLSFGPASMTSIYLASSMLLSYLLWWDWMWHILFGYYELVFGCVSVSMHAVYVLLSSYLVFSIILKKPRILCIFSRTALILLHFEYGL